MTNGYGEMDVYGTYGEGDLSPYEMLMQMKSWNKAIYLTIESTEKKVFTQLSVLDGEIRQHVADVEEGLETLVSTTAGGLDVKISDTNKNLSTHITVTAQGLASKVASKDFNGDKVASLIAQTSTAVTLMAQALNLSGYVTFNSLTSSGTTIIDGSRIQTGYISADRIQATTVLAKLIQAGGIDASYISSGTISADRLSANAITTTLFYAGGISAELITAGTISADRISGGTLSGVTIYSDQMASVGTTLNIGANAWGTGMIRFGDGYQGISASLSMGTMDLYGNMVTVNGAEIATTRTSGLGFGYSSSNGRLYVSIDGYDVGFIALT